jgi:hypothetical protein
VAVKLKMLFQIGLDNLIVGIMLHSIAGRMSKGIGL